MTSTSDFTPQDPIFAEEAAHLKATYAKLCDLRHTIGQRLKESLEEIRSYKTNMREEIAPDFEGDDLSMETYANITAANSVIESFNLANDADFTALERLTVALKKPYFARIRLTIEGSDHVRDIYLGSCGIADEDHRRIIVDWRSPIAEVYYNQDIGPTSYYANGRAISANLELRRQFVLERDHLKSYFDTSVAIEDALLLDALSSARSSRLQAITATIQKEQNAIVRTEPERSLLVRGIAGSGKTSVLLQRIAYLLFRCRTTLRAEQTYIVTPNPLFSSYIANVLPELGEKNPHILTWDDLVNKLGVAGRASGALDDYTALRKIDESLCKLSLEDEDFRGFSEGEHRFLTVDQVRASWRHFAKRMPVGPGLCTLVEEDLLEKLDRRLTQMAKSDSVLDEISELDPDDQEVLFGHVIDPNDEDDVALCARIYVESLADGVARRIENAEWLRLERIGMRVLGTLSLSACELLYLKIVLAGKTDEAARLIVIDEVQDYSVVQLCVLARYFCQARFLMVGDPNQSIYEAGASFEDIENLFRDLGKDLDVMELMRSYRSSPEITRVFMTLMSADESARTSSVRREGSPVRFCECLQDSEEPGGPTYLDTLIECIDDLDEIEGLKAVLVSTKSRAAWLNKILTARLQDKAPALLEGKTHLPPNGRLLIDLKTAKGLEFDCVIIADAQADAYPVDELHRKWLYCAASRATRYLTIISQGPMTALLDQARAQARDQDSAAATPTQELHAERLEGPLLSKTDETL